MVAIPGATPLATPLVVGVFETVATVTSLEVHITLASSVRSRVEPSENVAVTVNCTVNPAAAVGLVGVTSSDASVASVTVMVVDPATGPMCATMSAVPGATPVTTPRVPAAFDTVAIAGALVDHVTLLVTSSVVPSENVPVAV